MKNRIDGFLDNVNKLTVGRSTSDPEFGRVTCIESADHSRGINKFLKRTGYGTRKFSLSKSEIIHNGKYTLSGIRKKLNDYAFFYG